MADDQLKNEQKLELIEAFTLFMDYEEEITKNDLGRVMRSLGENLTDQELEDLTSKINPSRNGVLNLSEFLSLMAQRMHETPEHEEKIRDAFRVFDTDGDGLISAMELRSGLARLGEYYSTEQIEEMVTEADVDGDGKLNYEEFIPMLIAKRDSDK